MSEEGAGAPSPWEGYLERQGCEIGTKQVGIKNLDKTNLSHVEDFTKPKKNSVKFDLFAAFYCRLMRNFMRIHAGIFPLVKVILFLRILQQLQMISTRTSKNFFQNITNFFYKF